MTNTTNNAAQPSEDAVERVARALYNVSHGAALPFEMAREQGSMWYHGAREHARAALAAMPAQPSVEAWQPIETAPEVGPILLWPDGVGGCVISDKRTNDGTWWEGDWDYLIPATHWQRLPAPPTITEAPERKEVER